MAYTPHLAVVVCCYAVGGIPFGYIIGRLTGIDIRAHGSGNVGATNILRTCGKKWGYLCFLLDSGKGFVPVILVQSTVAVQETLPYTDFMAIAAVVSVISGHIWSPFLKFHGGKGVATAAGAVMALAPHAILPALVLWYVVFAISRYVSLASIAAVGAAPVLAIAIDCFVLPPERQLGRPNLVFISVLAGLVILKHRRNIERLLDGTENRFTGKGQKSDEDCGSQ